MLIQRDVVTTLFETEKELKHKGHKAPALVLLKADGSQVAYSWQEYVNEKALHFATALEKLRLVKKSEENFVAIMPLNLPESFFALLGTIMAGAVPVPIHPMLLKSERGREELKFILDNCKPRAILANKFLSPSLEGITHLAFEELLSTGKNLFEEEKAKRFYRTDQNLKKLLIMPYTSGTTGNPKGVMISHENVLDRTNAIIKELGVHSEDRVLSCLLLGHIAELIATFFGQMLGGYTVYFTEYATDREKLTENFVPVLRIVRPTIFLGVPTIWENLRIGIEAKLPKSGLKKFLPKFVVGRKVRKALGLDKARHFLSSAAPIRERELGFFSSLGMPIRNIYGQTETTGPLLIDGKRIGKTHIVVIECETNEIKVSGKGIMMGYYNNPEENNKVFRTTLWSPSSDEKDKDCESETINFYHTGDLGKYKFIGEPHPLVLYEARKGTGFKLANGEYVTEQTIESLQEKIRVAVNDIDPQAEVIVCGEGKSYLVALVFIDEALAKEKGEKLKETIVERVKPVGKGLDKIRGVAILSKQKYLLLTPTMKPRRGEILKNLKEIIEKI